jgi:hypothetical protein
VAQHHCHSGCRFAPGGKFGPDIGNARFQRDRAAVDQVLQAQRGGAFGARIDNADGVAAGATAGSPVVNYNYVWNGTNWDNT